MGVKSAKFENVYPSGKVLPWSHFQIIYILFAAWKVLTDAESEWERLVFTRMSTDKGNVAVAAPLTIEKTFDWHVKMHGKSAQHNTL